MAFIPTLWVNSGKSKQNNQNQDTIYFENAIYSVLHERSNNTFFRRAPKISRKNDLYTFIFGEKWQNKIKKNQNQNTMHFEIAI